MTLAASDVASLKLALGCWEWAEYLSTAVVFIGCLGEFFAEFMPYPSGDKRKHKLARLSLILVIAGIAGELLATVKTSQLSGLVIANVEAQAGDAKTSADGAAKDALIAKDSAKQARNDSDSAKLLAQGAREEADSFEKDIVSAKKQAADAESHLADALRRAAEAEKQAAESSLKLAELKRETAPRRITPEQRERFLAGFKVGLGFILPVKIWHEYDAPDGKDFARDLANLLQDAHVAVNLSEVPTVEPLATPKFSGIQLDIGRNRSRDADALERGLVLSGIVSPPITVIEATDPSGLYIIVIARPRPEENKNQKPTHNP